MSKSVRLKRWEPMLVEAEQLGWSVARYAKERGVAKSCLYAARSMILKRDRGSSEMVSSAKPFVEVRVNNRPTSEARLRAQLPNGVVMEMLVDGNSRDAVGALVSALGALPCSA